MPPLYFILEAHEASTEWIKQTKKGRKEEKKGKEKNKAQQPWGELQEGGGVVDAPRAARRCWNEDVLHVTR